MLFGPIQSQTSGFLSLLQLKDRGRNPSLINEEVRPSIEMAGYWLRGASVPTILAPPVFVNPNDVVALVVASQQEWVYVEYVHMITFGPLANQTRLEMISSPGAAPIPIWSSPWSESVTVSGQEQSVVEARGLWVPPGFQLVLVFHGAVGDGTGGGWFGARFLV